MNDDICVCCGAELPTESNTWLCRNCIMKTGNSKPQRIQQEAAEQETLFEWAMLSSGRFPELSLMYHIPNGGSRNAIEAANLKRQGVKAGVPDLFLPTPRGVYHGMFIEMKAGKNKLSEFQCYWINELQKQGYHCVVCYGWREAADAIIAYMKLKK